MIDTPLDRLLAALRWVVLVGIPIAIVAVFANAAVDCKRCEDAGGLMVRGRCLDVQEKAR